MNLYPQLNLNFIQMKKLSKSYHCLYIYLVFRPTLYLVYWDVHRTPHFQISLDKLTQKISLI